MTSMPQPVPAAAIPSAVLRRRVNHPPTIASVGTYPQAYTDAVRNVAHPHLLDEGGGDETDGQQQRAYTYDNPWPEVIAQVSGKRTERIEKQPRN
jgi:hypothetical protein